MTKDRNCTYRNDCEEVCTDCKDYSFDTDLKTITITTEEFKALKGLVAVAGDVIDENGTYKDIIDAIESDNYSTLKGV